MLYECRCERFQVTVYMKRVYHVLIKKGSVVWGFKSACPLDHMYCASLYGQYIKCIQKKTRYTDLNSKFIGIHVKNAITEYIFFDHLIHVFRPKRKFCKMR